MPSTSKKQAKFMAAAAHNPEFAKKVGISMDVAKEFNKADTGTRADLQKVAKQKTDHGKSKLFKEGGMATNKLKKLFKGKESMKEELAEAKAIKSGKITPMEYAKGEKMEGHRKGGKMSCMARGGGVEIKGKTKGKFIKMKGC